MDDLYEADILAWSEQQSGLLRRAARGERVNGLDWPHLVEEIESVGRSELSACRSLLRQALIHLLKIQGWPDSTGRNHWMTEALGMLGDARDRFSPSMRQNLDLPELYGRALAIVRLTEIDGRGAGTLPDACPFGLDDLLSIRPDPVALRARFDVGGGR